MTAPGSPVPHPAGPIPGRDISWHRSSHCVGGECVEVARSGGKVLVRDSKLGDDSPVLVFSRDRWTSLLIELQRGVRPDEVFYQRSHPLGALSSVEMYGERDTELAGPYLTFTCAEWGAFEKDVDNDKFDLDNLVPAAPSGVEAPADEAATTGRSAAANVTGAGGEPPIAPAPVAPMNGSPIGDSEDSPAGRGVSSVPLTTDGPLRVGQPGPDPIALGMIRMVQPEREPGDDIVEWAHQWAYAVYTAAFAAGFATARAGDGLPAWQSGPLVRHVPAHGEVAPVEGAGATEPAPEWERELMEREFQAREACLSTTHVGRPCGPGCIAHTGHVAS